MWEEFLRDRAERGFAREVVQPAGDRLGMRLLEQGLGSLRGAVGTPGQVRELCERYEAAGVDEVIFVSQAGRNRHEDVCESIELFAKEVLPGFAERAEATEAAKRERLAGATERALARREAPRASDPGYVVMPNAEPRPARAHPGTRLAVDGDAGNAGSSERPFDPVAAVRGLRDRWGETLGRPDLPDRLRRQGERAFAGFVRGRSDEQLDRVAGSRPVLRLVFRGMQQAFRPDRAGGFSGDIQYELDGRRGPERWVISIDGEHATAWPGIAANPALRVSTDVATFARMVAGELPAAKAWFEGKVRIEGDFQLAARLGEMFAQASPW